MTFTEWLQLGIEQGWVSEPVCFTHDGIPMDEQEDHDFIDGFDPCLRVIRIWEDE